jgi:MraZ protein
VLVATIKKIEIWDSSKYKKELFESFTPQAFSDLAKEVMKEIQEQI